MLEGRGLSLRVRVAVDAHAAGAHIQADVPAFKALQTCSWPYITALVGHRVGLSRPDEQGGQTLLRCDSIIDEEEARLETIHLAQESSRDSALTTDASTLHKRGRMKEEILWC